MLAGKKTNESREGSPVAPRQEAWLCVDVQFSTVRRSRIALPVAERQGYLEAAMLVLEEGMAPA